MSINKYVIAGLKVQMEVTHDLLRQRSEKYLCDFEGEPDIFLNAPEDKREILRRKNRGITEDVCEYTVTAAFFYEALIGYGGFLLHSSCLRYDGKAYMFTADSGTGKSTHTGLWREYIKDVKMINDDKPAIRLIDGLFYAAGTPWSGKTDQSENVLVPVGAVALLYRSEDNVINRSTNQKAVSELLKQTLLPPKKESTDKLADLLDKFIRTVPVYDFGCNISEQAVKTSFEVMTGKTYRIGNF
jgi:hypothetical protein